MKKLTGHLEEKNGKWYAAVNHYTTDGLESHLRTILSHLRLMINL